MDAIKTLKTLCQSKSGCPGRERRTKNDAGLPFPHTGIAEFWCPTPHLITYATTLFSQAKNVNMIWIPRKKPKVWNEESFQH